MPFPLRQSLAALIQAYDGGLGPIEREARARRAAHAPMTDREIAAVAETHYPVEVRTFLEANGQQALMREDLARALAVSAAADPRPSSPDTGSKPDPARSGRRASLAANVLRMAVLALAVAAGGLILHVGLPKIRAERASPTPQQTEVVAAPPARPAPETPCRRALRDAAAAWCERALIGTHAPVRTPETPPGACGDPMTANSHTVRMALNGLLDDGVIDTYGPSEARERCAAAAADLALPP